MSVLYFILYHSSGLRLNVHHVFLSPCFVFFLCISRYECAVLHVTGVHLIPAFGSCQGDAVLGLSRAETFQIARKGNINF